MNHSIILTPSIFFHKKQTEMISSLLKNDNKLIKSDEGDFYHFFINGQDYTFIISHLEQLAIYFIKGKYIDHTFKDCFVVFKNVFNLEEGAKYNNVVLTDDLKETNEFFRPKYQNISSRSALSAYAGFDRTAFKDFTSLLNKSDSLLGKEMFRLYSLEYDIAKYTISFTFNDLFNELGNDKFSSKRKMVSMNERGLFFRINDLLIENRDSWLNVIQFIDDEIIFYLVDKDKHIEPFTDDDYNNRTKIFFSNEDFFEKIDEVKSELTKYEIGRFSDDVNYLDMQQVFSAISSIENTNEYMSKKSMIFNESKKVKPNDLDDPIYELLSSSSSFWVKGELYDPNKIIGLDKSVLNKELKEYAEEKNYEYCVVTGNPLMTEYKINICDEWLDVIDKTIKRTKELNESMYADPKHEHLKDMGNDNIKSMMKCRNKVKGKYMPIKYKEQTPLFESEFLDNAIKEENYKSHFLGNYTSDGQEIDLFIIQYKDNHYRKNEYNSILKFGKCESEYASGATFMFRDVLNNKESGYSEIYKRALELNIIKEDVIYIGYSQDKRDEEEENYEQTEYFKNKPKSVELEIMLEMNDDEFEEAEEAHRRDVEAYDLSYANNGGKIPVSSHLRDYQIFKNEEEAIFYCGNNKGYFEKHNSINESHTNEIGFNKRFMSKFFEIEQRANMNIIDQLESPLFKMKFVKKVSIRNNKATITLAYDHWQTGRHDLTIELTKLEIEKMKACCDYHTQSKSAVMPKSNDATKDLVFEENKIKKAMFNGQFCIVLSLDYLINGDKYFSGVHFTIEDMDALTELL